MKRDIKVSIKCEKDKAVPEHVGAKEVLCALTLFFSLTVVTLLMISGKFRQGVENFWENNEKAEQAVEELELDRLFEA